MRRGWKIYFIINVILFSFVFFSLLKRTAFVSYPLYIAQISLLTLIDWCALYSYSFRKKFLKAIFWKLLFVLFIVMNSLGILYLFYPIPVLTPVFYSGETYSHSVLFFNLLLTLPIVIPDFYVFYRLSFDNERAFEPENNSTSQESNSRYSKSAIASFIMALFGFIFCPVTNIPSILLGIIGLIRIRNKKKKGKAYAWFGIGISFMQLIAFGGFMYLILKTGPYISDPEDEVAKKMTSEERSFLYTRLDQVRQKNTKKEVLQILGDPKKIDSTSVFTRYTYDCPIITPECSVIVDFISENVFKVGFIDTERFTYASILDVKTEDVTEFAADDPRIVKATKSAQDSIDILLSKAKNKDCMKQYECKAKKDFIVNGKHEHMWFLIFSYKDGFIHGRLSNIPEVIPTLHYGDSVHIPVTDIEDWTVYNFENDTITGGYSIKETGPVDRINDMKPKNLDNSYSNALNRVKVAFESRKAEKGWDLTKNMTWGFVFSDSNDEKLKKAGEAFGKGNFTITSIPNTKLYMLKMYENARYTPDTLLNRTSDMSVFAVEHDIESYDGWDVQPVDDPSVTPNT